MVKRLGLLGLVLALVLGLAATASHAAKAKKAASEVEVTGWHYPEGVWTIVGDVHSKKGKCERSRAVTILAVDEPTDEGIPVATVTTDETGDWELEEPDLPTGTLVAEVGRKKLGKASGKKLICKPDRSPAIEVVF